ncbi:MAG TPA: hypothetical protein VH440_12365 [Candidatus Limnocylindrales bacterium]
MTDEPAFEQLLDDAEPGEPPILAGLPPIAPIVATVEMERVLRDLGRDPGEAATAAPEPLLGALVLAVGTPDGPIALAEPATEGRLSATLARHGEGEVGRYLALADADDLDAFRARAAAAGVPLTRVESGPFGRSVLVLVRPVTGPHLIVVERRALPSPP